MSFESGSRLKNLWGSQGDRIIAVSILALLFMWYWWWFVIIPDRVDGSETTPIQIKTVRSLSIEKDFDPVQYSAMEGKSLKQDTMVVIDVSGSMKETNDPEQLALTSAKMFVDLLDNGSSLGVVLFNSDIVLEQALLPLAAGAASKEQVKQWFNTEYGGGTRFSDPLRIALSAFTSTSSNRRSILFMTDGIPQDKPPDPRTHLASEDIRLIPIGFGDGVDIPTLTYLSNDRHFLVKRAEDLPQTFADVFSLLNDTSAVEPLRKGSFYEFPVGKDVKALNIIAIVDNGALWDFKLFGGTGQIPQSRISGTDGYVGLDPRYVVIKLESSLIKEFGGDRKHPWRIVPSKQPKKLIAIPILSYRIKAELGPFDPRVKGVPIKRIRLIDESGVTFTDPDLKFSSIVEGPSGRYERPVRQAIFPSEYTGVVPFERSGTYYFRFRVEHPSFVRESPRVEFAFTENFTFNLLTDTVDLGIVKPGTAFAVRLVAATGSSTLSSYGERFALQPGPSPEGSKIRILDREAEILPANEGYSFLVRTQRGIPVLKPGSRKGDYSIPVQLGHYNGQTSTVLLEMHVMSLGFLEEWGPFIATVVLVLLSLLLLWGVLSYHPLPRGALVIKKDRGGILRWKTRVHPGNRWLFGKGTYDVGGGARIEAGRSGRLTLVKPDPDQKGSVLSEVFDWRIHTVCNGYTAYYFNAGKKNRDEVESMLDDAMKRHNRIYKGSVAQVELFL